MKLLDGCCCAGGASAGYTLAGFEVIGVDIAPQPHYPYPFILGDIIDVLFRMLAGEKFLASDGKEYGMDDFDAFHVSPPCQGYSITKSLPNVGLYPKLIEPVRALLIETGKPYVIENVVGAPLIDPLMLCGTMFGLKLIRHRLFETHPRIYFTPASHKCLGLNTNSHRGYSSFKNGAQAITCVGNNYNPKDGALAMGIAWMTRDELSEAIPPAYTEFIGRQIMNFLR